MNGNLFQAATVTLLLCLAIPTATADGGLASSPWPHITHDVNNTGQSPYQGPLTNHVNWSYTSGKSASYTSPVIGPDGTVYMGFTSDTGLTALNPDGTVKWKSTVPSFKFQNPVIGSDGTLYVSGLYGTDRLIYAIRAGDGTKKWSFDPTRLVGYGSISPTVSADGSIYIIGSYSGFSLEKITPGSSSASGVRYSLGSYGSSMMTPAIASDGTIYVTGGKYLTALTWPSGASAPTLKWQKSYGGYNYGSPVIGPDGTVYYTSVDGYLYAVNPAGSLKWNYNAGGSFAYGTTDGVCSSSPAVASDGTIYVGNYGNQSFYAINPDGTPKWIYNTGAAILGSPAIGSDGSVYTGCDDGNIYAFSSAGSLLWKYTTGASIRGTPAIGSDGTIYVASNDGKLYAIKDPFNFTADNTSGAFPLTVQFTATPITPDIPTGWSWDFGDGSPASNQQNPSHQYTTGGVYTVKLTATYRSGDVSIIRSSYITVYSPPSAAFTVNPSSGKAPFTAQFSDTSSGNPTAWLWDFNNDGIIDNTTRNPTYTYPNAGIYAVNLTVTNLGGSNSLIRTGAVTVTPPDQPAANFTADATIGKVPFTVHFNDTSTGYNITHWSWDFGDGTSSTARNATHTYTSTGNFVVALNATNDGGSNTTIRTGYISVTQRLLPVAAFTANATSGGVPFIVQFTDTSQNSPTSWLWDFGDGTTSPSQNPVHTYANGTYTVTLTVTNGDGSNSTTKTGYITVTKYGPLPNYRFINVYMANDAGVKYDVPNGVYASNGAYTYVPNTYWVMFRQAGGGGNPMHISSQSNTGTAADITTLSSQSGSFWITFSGGQPTMPDAILMLAVNGTIPDDFKVHIRSSGQDFDVKTPSIGNWYQGDGTIPYPVTFLDGAVNETFDKYDFIYGPQSWKPNSNPSMPIYGGEDQSDPTNQFRLMFIDLNVGAIQNASLTNNGMIKVEYEFTNLTSTAVFNSYGWYMGSNHGTGVIMTNDVTGSGYTVNAVTTAPVADFTSSTTNGYIHAPVKFTDTSANRPTSWLWDFGDGATSTSQSPSHAYAAAGTYPVKLTVTNSKGSDTMTKAGYITVTVPATTTSDFSADTTSGPTPLAVNFTDTSGNGAYTWSWDFGDGSTSVAQNPAHTYTLAGNFTVTLTATNAAGNKTTIKTGYISPTSSGAPGATFTATPVNGKAPYTVTFTDTSTGAPTTWLWDFGDGSTSMSRNPTHTYTKTGTFSVTLTVTNAAGSNSVTKSSLVYVASVTGSLPASSGLFVRAANHDGIRYDTTGNGTYYIPALSAGGGLAALGISTDPAQTGGKVSVTKNQSGSFYATSTGSYQDGIILLLAVNGTIPDDFAVRIKSSGYTWTPTGSAPSAGSCTYASSGLDQTFTKPDLFYGPQNWKPTQGDANYPLFFGEDMASGVNRYQLMFIDTRTGVLRNSSLANNGAAKIEYAFTDLPDNAQFNVYGWKTGQGMAWTNSQTGSSASGLTVISPSVTIPPVASFSAKQQEGLAPFNVRFQDASQNSPASWTWDFGDGNTSTSQNPSHIYTVAGTYAVNLTVRNSAGTNTLSRSSYITVNAPVTVTNSFAIPGITAATNGTLQNATIAIANATLTGNVVNVTQGTGTWDHLAVTFNETPAVDGANWTGTVTSVQAVLMPQLVPIASLNYPNVSLSLSLAGIPNSTSSVTSTITSDTNATSQTTLAAAVANGGNQLVATAYSVTFAKSDIGNAGSGGIIQSATISMAVNHTWVSGNGGSSFIKILHQADDGTSSVLPTNPSGSDIYGNDIFTAVSPYGLSTFVLAAVSPVATSPNNAYGYSYNSGGGDPGYVNTKVPTIVATTQATAAATTVATIAPVAAAPSPTAKLKVRITTVPPTGLPAPMQDSRAAPPSTTGPIWLKNPLIVAIEGFAAVVLVSVSIVTLLRRRRRRRDPLR